jgi:hypothetical protein
LNSLMSSFSGFLFLSIVHHQSSVFFWFSCNERVRSRKLGSESQFCSVYNDFHLHIVEFNTDTLTTPVVENTCNTIVYVSVYSKVLVKNTSLTMSTIGVLNHVELCEWS